MTQQSVSLMQTRCSQRLQCILVFHCLTAVSCCWCSPVQRCKFWQIGTGPRMTIWKVRERKYEIRYAAAHTVLAASENHILQALN